MRRRRGLRRGKGRDAAVERPGDTVCPSQPRGCESHVWLLPAERWMRRRCCGKRGTWASVHQRRLPGGGGLSAARRSHRSVAGRAVPIGLGKCWRDPGAGRTLTPRCKFTRRWVSPWVGDAQGSQGAWGSPSSPHTGEKISSIAANKTFQIDF